MVQEEDPRVTSNGKTSVPSMDDHAALLGFALEAEVEEAGLGRLDSVQQLKKSVQQAQGEAKKTTAKATNGNGNGNENGNGHHGDAATTNGGGVLDMLVEHAPDPEPATGGSGSGSEGEGEGEGEGGEKSALSSWSEEEAGRFLGAYQKHGADWAQVATEVASRQPSEVQAFHSAVKEYLEERAKLGGAEASPAGLWAFFRSALAAGEAAETPRKQQQQQQQNGKAGAKGRDSEANGKMTWASSGERSDRKKRPVQQVRPVVSPDKPKSKSPDVLMTSVIETLAQAASVSRSNPGTPQSKLEQSSKQKAGRGGAGGKGNASPKPRKRLFADDVLAASALLGLASTSDPGAGGKEASGGAGGRPAKKGKSSRPSTPKSTPKKQMKNLMDNFRTQPLKELSGLAGPAQVKPRSRRKPDHSQRFPGPMSPIMKLHKRFSAFKGASSSPNAKVLERQLKLQSSLDGLLGWGEKTPAPPGSLLNRIQNCLSPSMRRWCYYEWFYSAVDKLWFEKNRFQDLR